MLEAAVRCGEEVVGLRTVRVSVGGCTTLVREEWGQ